MATPSSQELWRAALHDLQGCLGTLQGVLEFREADGGLEARDADRLQAMVREGLGILALGRSLSLGTWPSDHLEPGSEWRRGLGERLAVLEALFKSPVILAHIPDSALSLDRWPGPLLQSWAASLSRLVLPQALPEPLRLETRAEARAWTLRWSPVLGLPQGLRSPEEGRAWDLNTLWCRAVVERLRIQLRLEDGILTAVVPRKPEGGV